MSNDEREPIGMNITYGDAKDVHLQSHYRTRDSITDIIKSSAMSGRSVDYDAILLLVEHDIASIPNLDVGNQCIKIMYEKYDEVLTEIKSRNGHDVATASDIDEAKRQIIRIGEQLVQVIYDDDIGIRSLQVIGTA